MHNGVFLPSEFVVSPFLIEGTSRIEVQLV